MSSQGNVSGSPLKQRKTVFDKLEIAKEKEKQKKEINDWRSLRAKIKKSLGYYENIRSNSYKSCISIEQNEDCNLQNASDIIKMWKDELYQYSGLYCSKYNECGEYRFEFISSKSESKNETYFVEILEEEAKGTLGVWRMPLLLDMNEVLLKNPIDDIRRVRSFVLLCNHYLHCQEIRESQFKALKAYIVQLHLCFVQANAEIYTCIQLQMFKLQEMETDTFYDIALYLFYELNECRPKKLIIDSLNEELLPEDVTQKLRRFFKNFKALELKTAFELTFNESNNTYFQWEKTLKNNEFSTESDEEETDLSREETIENGADEENEEEYNNVNGEEGNENQRYRSKKSVNKGRKPNKRKENLKIKLKHLKNMKKVASVEKSDINEKEINSEKAKGTRGIDSKKANETGIKGKGKMEKEKHTEEGRQMKKKTLEKERQKEAKKKEKSGKQATLDFSRKTNIEQSKSFHPQTKNSEGIINDETKIDQETNQHENGKNGQKNIVFQKFPKSYFSQPVKDKEVEIKDIEKISSKITENSDEKERDQLRKKCFNLKSRNKNASQQELAKSGAQKGRKLKSKSSKELMKKTFYLSNFVLKKQSKNILNNESSVNKLLVKTTSANENSKCSTPIPNKTQRPFQIDNEISEIIETEKRIRKFPEKRSRISDSSDFEFEEIVEEPDQSLLQTLEDFQQNSLNVRNDNKKGAKTSKGVKKRVRKAKKL